MSQKGVAQAHPKNRIWLMGHKDKEAIGEIKNKHHHHYYSNTYFNFTNYMKLLKTKQQLKTIAVQ